MHSVCTCLVRRDSRYEIQVSCSYGLGAIYTSQRLNTGTEQYLQGFKQELHVAVYLRVQRVVSWSASGCMVLECTDETDCSLIILILHIRILPNCMRQYIDQAFHNELKNEASIYKL